jgi:hypothetical protein
MDSLVHTETYHPLLGIRLKPSCEPVLSWLPACAVHRLQHASSPQSARWTGPQGGACRAQTATGIIALRCAPRIPAHNSISEYIPVYTGIYQSVHSIYRYIPVCTVHAQVYAAIYAVYTSIYRRYIPVCTQYIPVYTCLYSPWASPRDFPGDLSAWLSALNRAASL